VKKLMAWFRIGATVLAGLFVVVALLIFALSERRLNKRYAVSLESVPLSTSVDVLAKGEHLVRTRGCVDCHGDNLAGGLFIDDPAIGRISATNLTAGQGGVGGAYTDEDWVRAIRHGVGPDGKPLLFMPAQEFYFLSDEDLGALISYLKNLPAVDNTPPQSTIRPMGRVLFLAGKLPLLPAETIDHDAPRPTPPAPGVTVAYGRYLAVGCTGCHGEDYAGGPIPGMPPGAPPAANLTPAGPLAGWTEAEFIAAMRTGVKPDGQRIRPAMPIAAVGSMTDEELRAVWVFLRSLPPVENDF